MNEEMHQQFHRFIDRVSEVVAEVFDLEAQHPAVVLGVQFGEMGDSTTEPVCLVSSNLPPCVVPHAIMDMHEFAEVQHEQYHASEATDAGLMSLLDGTLGIDAEQESKEG